MALDAQRVAGVLKKKLTYVYCDTCARGMGGGTSAPGESVVCDECCRKSMNWTLSDAAALSLAEAIREVAGE